MHDVRGDLARDREPLRRAARVARLVTDLPDDPHLHYATDVHSSRVVRSNPLPAPEGIIATVLDAARASTSSASTPRGRSIAASPTRSGSATGTKSRSFNLGWWLYHRATRR